MIASGFSLLVSDHNKVALVDISEFSPDAARAAKTGQAVVGTREGVGPDQPSFFAQAFVPVVANDRVIAVVAAYVDQTEQRNSFNATFLKAAAALCLSDGLVVWRSDDRLVSPDQREADGRSAHPFSRPS